MPQYKSRKDKLRSLSRKVAGGCIEWTGSVNHDGYGIICWGDKKLRAHRIAYEEYYKPISDDMIVHHTCANRKCINPQHLQAITPQQNVAEMRERNAYQKKIKELEKRLEKYEGKK